MADKDLINYDETNSASSENLFNDEWAIIGDNSSSQEDNDNDNKSNGESQETLGSMEELNMPNDDTLQDEFESFIIEKQEDESDGISVITESEAEQLLENKQFDEVDCCKTHLCKLLKVYEKPEEKTPPQVGTILNVVIACSLAAIIGLGAGRILGIDDKCPITSAVDFSTIKMESEMLISQMKELSEVKDVLDKIKANIPQVTEGQNKFTYSGSKSKAKLSEQCEKSSKLSDTYIFDPDTIILEQLQTSLSTLCSVINDMKPEHDFISFDASKTHSIVKDLIQFKKIIYTIVRELGDTGRPKEMAFLRNAERRIKDICNSLLNDLSYTVHGLTMKIHHKLNRVRTKLNKRLCYLKNSESMNGKLFTTLEENNSFLESCDKILNVSLKPNTRYKRDVFANKTHFNMSNNLDESSTDNFASETDDPRESSSDSSIPDLTYNREDHSGFRKNKRKPLREGKKTKPYFNERLLRVNTRPNRMKRTKPMKPHRISEIMRNSMMKVLLPAESSTLTQVPWLKCEPVRQDTQEPELSTLNDKPLYSIILKAVNNTITQERSNSNGTKSRGKELYGNEQVPVKQTSQETIMEVNSKGKVMTMETKHNVTPAESNVNDHSVKSMQNQWNANVRQQVITHYGGEKIKEIVWKEEVWTEKHDEPQLMEKIEKVSSPSVKHCRKGKKCFNNSIEPNEFNKRPATTTNYPSNKKRKTTKREQTMNSKPVKIQKDNNKKQKKDKLERKVSSAKVIAEKEKKDFKRQEYNLKFNDQLSGDWQLQRSRAREVQREHNDRDPNFRTRWFFGRAKSRQVARNNIDGINTDGADIDEKFFDDRFQTKNANAQKHSDSSTRFTARKSTKASHRKNILQRKH